MKYFFAMKKLIAHKIVGSKNVWEVETFFILNGYYFIRAVSHSVKNYRFFHFLKIRPKLCRSVNVFRHYILRTIFFIEQSLLFLLRKVIKRILFPILFCISLFVKKRRYIFAKFLKSLGDKKEMYSCFISIILYNQERQK